ncbi:MAG: flagellar motor protein MotB [Segetibacter sp.]|nr:flagellar motor protein MotB [Segetibacter sp.]
MKRISTSLFRISICSFAVLTSVLSANAQFAYNYLKAANNYFNKGDYYSASQYYEKYISTNNTSTKKQGFEPYTIAGNTANIKSSGSPKSLSRAEVVYKIGESYRMLRNFVKAEPYYKELADLAQQFPHARFWLAKSLRSNSKFDDAEAEFSKFINEYPTADSIRNDAGKELANLRFIQAQLKKTDIKNYKINRLTADGQSHGADYAPSLLNNNSLVFTSTRIDSTEGETAKHINRLYEVATNSSASAATKLNIPQPSNVHQGVNTFSPDGSKMYLTKWSGENVSKSAAIYLSRKENGKWSDPVLLAGDVNATGFNSQQPFVTADGKSLYYASDKPGGEGMFDLWIISLQEDGNPASSSLNLGKTINTANDEQAPFYHNGKTLVFSNNGRVGMGGYDLFQAEGTTNSWKEPENLGYPVNSVKDDIYLVSNGSNYLLDNVYISSDRSSECCLELYNISKVRMKKVFTGVVVDCSTGSPIAATEVKIVGTNNAAIANITTNEQGRYEVLLDEYQPLTVTAGKAGYIAKTHQITAPADAERDTLATADICLAMPIVEKPYEENKQVVVDSVFYEFDKHKLKPSSYPSLNVVVDLLTKHPTAMLEISAHTDSHGSDEYNLELSELRAKSVVEYLVSKGIEATRLQSKGHGETMPIAPNTKVNGKDNPAGRAKNRRVEFKVIHY